MATKLDSLITNSTTGEAISYYGGQSSNNNVQFKQTFEVTTNSDYTWTIKVSLYLRLNPNYPSGEGARLRYGVWQRLHKEYYTLEKDIHLLSLSGHWIDGVQVSNNAYEYYKVMENSIIVTTSTGRKGQRLDCGYINDNSGDPYSYYWCTEYTQIYVTLPSFSGMSYKINGEYKRVMPWIKVNGTWKRTKQYIKVNDTWHEYNDTWIYNPEA